MKLDLNRPRKPTRQKFGLTWLPVCLQTQSHLTPQFSVV